MEKPISQLKSLGCFSSNFGWRSWFACDPNLSLWKKHVPGEYGVGVQLYFEFLSGVWGCTDTLRQPNKKTMTRFDRYHTSPQDVPGAASGGAWWLVVGRIFLSTVSLLWYPIVYCQSHGSKWSQLFLNSILVALKQCSVCQQLFKQILLDSKSTRWITKNHGWQSLGARHGLVVGLPIPFHDSYAVCISDLWAWSIWQVCRWVFPKIGVGPQNGWWKSWQTLWTNGWFGGKTHHFRKHPDGYTVETLMWPNC